MIKNLLEGAVLALTESNCNQLGVGEENDDSV